MRPLTNSARGVLGFTHAGVQRADAAFNGIQWGTRGVEHTEIWTTRALECAITTRTRASVYWSPCAMRTAPWRVYRGGSRRRDQEGEDRHEEPSAMSIQFSTVNDTEAVTADSGGVDTEKKITRLARGLRSRMLSLFRRSPGIVTAGSLAVLFAAAYLIAPPMGRDFSAQYAHAQLAESHWPALLDLRWYGGFNPLGYSVLSPPVMALLGVRLTTALAYVASVILFAALLKETRVVRPVAGAIMAAICLSGNLVTTRTTFALGLALGLGALVALVAGRLRITLVLCVLAPLCSPVAGLFLAVAGSALVLSGRWRGGVIITLTALAPTIAMELAFGNGGRQSFGLQHAVLSFLICLLVAGLGWRRSVIRWGALLSAGVVAAAYLLPTPVGTTAARLPELFAAP